MRYVLHPRNLICCVYWFQSGQALPHRKLLQSVWGPDYGEETEYLRVFINQLRKKIEADPSNPRYIRTEPWIGYRFEAPPAASRS